MPGHIGNLDADAGIPPGTHDEIAVSTPPIFLQIGARTFTFESLAQRLRPVATSRVHEKPMLRIRTILRWVRVLVLFVAVLCVGMPLSAQQIESYSYDAAGNVVSIQRLNPVVLVAITGFAPTYGLPTTRVADVTPC